MDDAVRELAREAGIANEWTDAFGKPQRVSISSLRSILIALGLPCATAADIRDSRARVAHDDGRPRIADREVAPPVASPRCISVKDIAPGVKLWGIGLQLYSLRGARDHGIGDTSALRDFVARAAAEGADAVALSPTHSLFAADVAHYGPYSPSNRLFLNTLYADPSVVFGEARVAAVDVETRASIPPGALIDWPKVAPEKYALLRRLFDDFAGNELQRAGDALAQDFRNFVSESGERLREHALFEALHAHWLAQAQPRWNWNEWPAEWRAPNAPAAAQFAKANPREIEFHMFAQWLAERSFAAAQQDARDAGMRIGLISDIAVGMSPGGSHAWSRPQDLLPGLSVGAPPDLINTRGQDWGLTAFSPRGLAAANFEPFIATLRAAMRHAGGVRIDHVMGLARLWLVPRGASATEGAYLSYPLDDMLRLIALESQRHHAIVIGEDLGTVEPAFRDKLSATGIAGMDVLWFQRNVDGFIPSTKWRRDAVAMTTTHDLPTVAGWWSGADIKTRAGLGFADRKTETKERAVDRKEIWIAFQKAGVAEKSEPPAGAEPAVDAAIAFTARSPASLALIPIEDILGLAEQPNLPGTIDEHPNWRRRLGKSAAELFGEPRVRARLKVLRERA